MALGWSSQTCKHGHTHWVLSQTSLQGCGLAVCGMIIHRKKGIQHTDTDLLLSWKFRTTRWPSRDDDIEALLGEYGVSGRTYKHLSKSRMKDLVRAASTASPIVAAVAWQGASTGHWIVIEGRTTQGLGRSSSYCVCDPLEGVVLTSLSGGELDVRGPTTDEAFNLPGLIYKQKLNMTGVLKGVIFVPS
jgi:Papain-like cysteine protease AvrRpt2